MIAFCRDKLVPRELCELLYQTVPESYHVPVVFTSHKSHCEEVYGRKAHFPAGSAGGGVIAINVNELFGHVAAVSGAGSLSARMWYGLLMLCFHEFGHVATQGHGVGGAEYAAGGRGFLKVEHLASVWATRQMHHLLGHDARLGQPSSLTGYVGARVEREVQSMWSAEWGSARVGALKEWRCYQCGGQLSVGDVWSLLGWPGAVYAEGWSRSVRRGLRHVRRALAGRGKEYVDRAGRLHRYYTWGDVMAAIG